MKKQVLTILFCISAIIGLNTKSNAQSILIHYWNFNSFTWNDTLPNATVAPTVSDPTIHGLAADYSRIDTSKAKILYAKQAGVSSAWPEASYLVGFTYIDPYIAGAADADNVNLQMGDTVSLSTTLRTRNPSDSMEVLFYIPTTNYQNILLQYACERSGSGMLHQLFDVSIDSGATWTTAGLPITIDSVYPVFTLHSISLAGVAGSSNNPKLVFRVKFENNDAMSNGNNRWDNVTVKGDTSTSSSSGEYTSQVTAQENTYSIVPNPATNSIYISSAAGAERTVTIYNTMGQKMISATQSGNSAQVNTSALNAGMYYLHIMETNTGNVSTLKFVKQ